MYSKADRQDNELLRLVTACLEKLVVKDIQDEKYRFLLNKEYQYCVNNAARIQKSANKIYEMVTENRKQILTDNSCDFKILEQGYLKYINEQSLDR